MFNVPPGRGLPKRRSKWGGGGRGGVTSDGKPPSHGPKREWNGKMHPDEHLRPSGNLNGGAQSNGLQ